MDLPIIYADLRLARAPAQDSAPSSTHPPEGCRGPCWHGLAWKLFCAAVTLLVLGVAGLSVAVVLLMQKSPAEEGTVDIQENRIETTVSPIERPAMAACPVSWHQLGDKCLFLSSTPLSWNDSLTDCSTKQSNLLLIHDAEELRLLWEFLEHGRHLYWIGLHRSVSGKTWKWTNGSEFSSSSLQLMGVAQDTSVWQDKDTSVWQDNCAVISHKRLYPESCQAELRWICQKERSRKRSRR
ncbi:killer cell lectin-like receptor subfamily B member 1 [Dipodomys merriami]|uniref:killer cell lectin-like receptor subfamily B member 1 n=1 Tax=Dipodomys merriami TaxID=94247 RepID=UPI003855E428